ncbi:MAG: cadherin-like beta sandwich domain-containing protein [Clostridia bacterium]|nr:cadherin-like beta sandwich domain-containing protein [Clostridia bacterium]
MKELVKKVSIILISLLAVFIISQTSSVHAASDNANLSNLGYTPEDFTGFKPDITTYNTTVPYNVRTIKVYAKTQDSGATYDVTGNTSLEVGKNVITVKVTAADKVTTKTYTMNVTRQENEMHIGISDEEAAIKKEEEKQKQETEKQAATSSLNRYSEPHSETGWIIIGVVLFIMTIILIAMIILGEKNKQRRH